MVAGLESSFPKIYLKSGKRIKHLGGKDCFYIHAKAKHYYEFYLPPGFQLTLPKNLAKALGYLNHDDRIPPVYKT